MPQTFVIDQAATFAGVAFLESAPRFAFGTQDQDRTADGTPKWDVSLVASFKDGFGRSQHEVIKVGIAAHQKPGEGLAQYTPVQLVNFVVGVVPPEIRKDARGQDKVSGGSTWYRADALQAPTTGRGRAAQEG
jgi:hypothetical protein